MGSTNHQPKYYLKGEKKLQRTLQSKTELKMTEPQGS